ncbi:MAG TPA: transporter [Stellaceae bacterium]|nr:transporter [Stellaceae bacterium]
MRAGVLAILLAAAAPLLAGGARGQEMEPRTYAASPIDTNFLILGYAHTSGSVSLVPTIPITGVEATIDSEVLAYSRTFPMFGRTASIGIALPFVEGTVSGNVMESAKQVTRQGMDDIGLRFGINFLGSPALTPAEFARREPRTSIGASLAIFAPTGDYNPNHLINIGSNRWAFKPELGFSQPIGDWFVDGSAGIWFFGENGNFFGGHSRGQEPLGLLQAHVGYNFRPGLWLAGDASYFVGGESSLDGVSGHDTLRNSRYGLTLSVPIGDGLSMKVAWSSWLKGTFGANFNTFGAALQYRWFDR